MSSKRAQHTMQPRPRLSLRAVLPHSFLKCKREAKRCTLTGSSLLFSSPKGGHVTSLLLPSGHSVILTLQRMCCFKDCLLSGSRCYQTDKRLTEDWQMNTFLHRQIFYKMQIPSVCCSTYIGNSMGIKGIRSRCVLIGSL